MKVAIIAFNNLKFSPYIFPYVKILKEINATIELIYPDRNGIEETFNDGALVPIEWDFSKKKIFNFISFRKNVIRKLSREKYDFVIVLTTFPAVLLGGFLSRKYKNKYLVDIRDFTHENNKFYYKLEKSALKNAVARVISAEGFKNFLPEEEYLFCPNVSSVYKENARRCSLKKDGPIIVGYVGSIAYKDNCKKLIDIIKEDERFAFHFYGNENGEATIKKYVESVNCERIKYFGEYNPSEKAGILEKTDILFNVYGNDKMLLKHALSNKLYDSMYFKKPLLVSPETDMKTESAEFSFAVDLDKSKSLNELYEWYVSIDEEAFGEYADLYLKNAFEKHSAFESKLKKAFTESV